MFIKLPIAIILLVAGAKGAEVCETKEDCSVVAYGIGSCCLRK